MSDEEPLTCMNAGDERNPCQGEVAYHSLGMGRAFPRCDKHWAARLRTEDEINRKYNPSGSCAPEGFDPDYAGERWDDDY